MSKKFLLYGLTLVCAVAVLAPAVAQAQTCEPLDNGRLANVFHEGTVLGFEPVVEFREMVLTITGPCEDIVRVFGPKDQISFDIREIERVTDGQYSWELRRVANIDPGVQEDLQAARGTGEEDALWWSYFQKGDIPEGPYVDSGAFSVERGLIVDPTGVEEKRTSIASKAGAVAAGLAPAAGPTAAGGGGDNPLSTKDFVINDDLIVIGSTCIGFDCVNGEAFGFDTLRFKENNTRIQFNDTSGSSFPTNNWQIRANSSQSGGESFLGFMDQGATGESENGTRVFAVEAGAGSNALFVESGGDVGVGTGNPVLNIHVVDGDSPGLRLEQDGSSGFQPQIWDIAGNETNFFVRDVTSGSTLPFRIFPGSPSSSLVIRDGQVGIGTSSPDGDGLEIERGGSAAQRILLRLKNNGAPQSEFEDTSNSITWRFGMNSAGDFVINDTGDLGTAELRVTTGGDVFVNGVGPLNVPDYVFEPDYELMPLDALSTYIDENGHLPNVQTAEDVRRTGGLNITRLPVQLLEKVEELTLYTLQQERRIAELTKALDGKRSQVDELGVKNAELSAAQAALAGEIGELRRVVASLATQD